MNQIGLVENIVDNNATIFVRRTSSCGENCKSCGSSCNIEGIRINLKVDSSIKKGDYVEIESKTKHILKYAAILYGIPLAIMVLTILISLNLLSKYNNNETISILFGLLSLALSSIILKKYDNMIKEKEKIQYFIKRVL